MKYEKIFLRGKVSQKSVVRIRLYTNWLKVCNDQLCMHICIRFLIIFTQKYTQILSSNLVWLVTLLILYIQSGFSAMSLFLNFEIKS